MRRVSIAREPNAGFEDRVAVTALALLEGAAPQPVDGLRRASLDDRAVERLHVLPQARAVEAVLHDLGAWPRSVMRIVMAVVVLLVALGSAAIVSSSGAVSVPAVIVGTLGLQTLLLLVWLLSFVPGVGAVLRRVLAGALTGPAKSLAHIRTVAAESIRTPEAVAEWIARWKRGTERDHAVLAASVEALSIAYAPSRSSLASLVYGIWSNAAWVAANLLMLAVLAVQLLRSRNYTLHSGLISPELSREWVEMLSRVLATVLPASLLPDAEAMTRASLEPAGIASDSWKWGTMVLASIVAFGLLPRVVALMFALGVTPWARRRWRLPWDDARLAATRGVIESSAPPVTIVAREREAMTASARANAGAGSVRAHGGANDGKNHTDHAGHDAIDARSRTRAHDRATRPALLLVGDASDPLGGQESDARVVELGTLTGGGLDAAEATAQRIRSEQLAPLILACAVTTAPRLGVADLLREPVRAADGDVLAILTDAARLRRGSRLADLDAVMESWRRLLTGLGVSRVLEVDASLPTPRGLAQLRALLTGHGVRATPPALLPKALESIVDAAASWGERDPSGADERRLLDRLGTMYGVDGLTRRAPFVAALADDTDGAHAAMVRAAGAVGSMAGLTTLEAQARAADRRSTALRGAVLLAVELEYQGTGESAISRAVSAALRAWSGEREERDAAGSLRDRAERTLAALAGGVA